ncbi:MULTISPECIES: AraC family ligand binding domain-containing protein [unclassified Paenibacillus]|uniref:AraC family ligand binding domain-containing protein n=1 Tax=unclassified Paenibacillus TaxID=185978 RepID=UPI002405FCB9|nr:MULTISPECIES: AraC family ligand binding domain-containing protein [unclassified Paenibacillus]
MTTTKDRAFAPPPRFILAEIAHCRLVLPADRAEEAAGITGRLEHHAIYIVISGKGMLYAGGRGYSLFSGSCLFLPPRLDVRIQADRPEAFVLFRLLYVIEGGAGLSEAAELLLLDQFSLLIGRLERLLGTAKTSGSA